MSNAQDAAFLRMLQTLAGPSPETDPLAAAALDQRLHDLAEFDLLWESFGGLVAGLRGGQRQTIRTVRAVSSVAKQIADQYAAVLPLLNDAGCGREVIQRGIAGTPAHEQLGVIPNDTLDTLAKGHEDGKRLIAAYQEFLHQKRGGRGVPPAKSSAARAASPRLPVAQLAAPLTRIPRRLGILLAVLAVLLMAGLWRCARRPARRPPPESVAERGLARAAPVPDPTPDLPQAQARVAATDADTASAGTLPPGPALWQTKAYRVTIAAPGGEQSRTVAYYVNSLGMELAAVPPGEFTMGSETAAEEVVRRSNGGVRSQSLAYQYPAHRVKITRPFFIGACEVTVREFEQFVADTGYRTESEQGRGARGWTAGGWKTDPETTWRRPGFASGADHPVVCVTWNDAQAFCAWLSKKEGVTYRLPTEAEWEYACRAGTTTAFSTGDTLTTRQANFNGRLTYAGSSNGPWRACTVTARAFPANPWGLYGMHGNAHEWCQDAFAEDYYAHSPAEDPTGPSSGVLRVVRGGSWYEGPVRCRSAHRDNAPPVRAASHIGFRVVAAQ